MYDIRKFKTFSIFKEKFLSKIPKEYFTKEYEDKCWLWKGGGHSAGYGRVYWDDKRYFAHQISYIIFNGIIPDGKVIRHTCNNPICINPKHLILGYKYENSIDMVKANRQAHQRLNEEAVKVIKWMLKYKYKKGLGNKLAKLYNVKRNTISNIKNNHSWAWLKV
jgi:hypothetical protein